MIIKSMSRKVPSFAQLYDYITRDGDYDDQFTYSQNFILRSRDEIIREFERNSSLLSRRKNGNYLYHEVISITRAKQLSEERQKELLQDIITQYAKSRGKDCLIFGGMHDEKDNNLHYHLMISANTLNQHRRYSLKKATFNKIKKLTELYVLERYPELEQAKLISKEHVQGKTSNKEQELKRRTGKPSQKDVFKVKLQAVFEESIDKQQFFDNLKHAKVEIYTRGKTIGFVDLTNSRRHRLKTLGLESEFERVNQTLSNNTSSSDENANKDHSSQAHQSSSENDYVPTDERAVIDERLAEMKQRREQQTQVDKKHSSDQNRDKGKS